MASMQQKQIATQPEEPDIDDNNKVDLLGKDGLQKSSSIQIRGGREDKLKGNGPINGLIKDSSIGRMNGSTTSKRLNKMSGEIVNDLQSQIELLQKHYDKQGGSVTGTAKAKEKLKGLTATQLKSLNELARKNKINVGVK